MSSFDDYVAGVEATASPEMTDLLDAYEAHYTTV